MLGWKYNIPGKRHVDLDQNANSGDVRNDQVLYVFYGIRFVGLMDVRIEFIPGILNKALEGI